MKAIILIFLFSIPVFVFSRTLTVSNGGSYTSLHAAVEASKDGDTILIKKGVYQTSAVVIKKSLTILGEGFPELNGAGKEEILILNGQKIRVRGIYFNNSGYSSVNDIAAIKLVDSHSVTIEGNRFAQTYFGIHASNSTYFTIRNNELAGRTKTEQTTGNGIHLWKCDHALIEGNKVTGHRDGIYFEFVTASLIRNNTSFSNIRYGLHFMFSHSDTYSGNTFRKNGSGVAVMYSHNVTIAHNLFDENWGGAAYGILMKEITDSKIERNTFYKNTLALHLEGTTRIAIQKNIFRENGWAVKVQASCSENNFNQNNFIGNTFDIGTNGTMVLNQFSQNYWDKYEGYDINKDGTGDVPYHPVSMYSMITEENPNSLMLLRSFMVSLLDKAEKAIPSLTPENLVDNKPLMKPLQL